MIRSKQATDSQDFQTVVLKKKKCNGIITLISDEEREQIVRARMRRSAENKINKIDAYPQRRNSTNATQRVVNQFPNQKVNQIDDRETSEDEVIQPIFSSEKIDENSDRFFKAVVSFIAGIIIMSVLVFVIMTTYNGASALINREMFGDWPTTHLDVRLGFRNEDANHPTHVIAINDSGTNDSGTFVIIIIAPYSNSVQRLTLSVFGFKKTDVANLSEVTINGKRTLKVQVENNEWYMILSDDGKSLIPLNPANDTSIK